MEILCTYFSVSYYSTPPFLCGCPIIWRKNKELRFVTARGNKTWALTRIIVDLFFIFTG